MAKLTPETEATHPCLPLSPWRSPLRGPLNLGVRQPASVLSTDAMKPRMGQSSMVPPPGAEAGRLADRAVRTFQGTSRPRSL